MSAGTFSWGDPDAELFGSVGPGLALLFAGGAAIATAVGADAAATVEATHQSWQVRWEGEEGGWDLSFVALTPPLAVGVWGSEQGCRVTGTVRAGARRVTVDCLGQRGDAPDRADLEGRTLARTLSAWLAPDRFVALSAARPEDAEGHADEEVEAWLVTPEEADPVRVDEARLSTTYDGDGRPLRAGLELWLLPDSPYPRRIGGEARGRTSLDLGARRLDAAFFAWTMDGHRGVGRYDVLRRA